MPKSRIEKAATNVIVWGFFAGVAAVVVVAGLGVAGLILFGIRQLPW